MGEHGITVLSSHEELVGGQYFVCMRILLATYTDKSNVRYCHPRKVRLEISPHTEVLFLELFDQCRVAWIITDHHVHGSANMFVVLETQQEPLGRTYVQDIHVGLARC